MAKPAPAPTATRELIMLTGLSGPHLCLVKGDRHPFDDTPAADGGPSEAQRLINAGFAAAIEG